MHLTLGITKSLNLHSRSLGEFRAHEYGQIVYDRTILRTRANDGIDDTVAQSSRSKKLDEESSDNPFIDHATKVSNAMPSLPSKHKKVYLEDYENFSVKSVYIFFFFFFFSYNTTLPTHIFQNIASKRRVFFPRSSGSASTKAIYWTSYLAVNNFCFIIMTFFFFFTSFSFTASM